MLDGISLDIGPGEVVGLVGESGCGKTTLARAILGILPAGPARIRGGEVRFKGTDLLREDPAVVNDRVRGPSDHLHPAGPLHLVQPRLPRRDADHGSDEVEVAARWPPGGGAAVDAARATRASATAPTATPCWTRCARCRSPSRPGRCSRLPHEFSGGQRQRLMIAMALLPRPDLIIADEPTTSLDVTIQAQILRLLRELVKERGVSVLFTTHDLGTAHEICDRVVVMYAGQEMEAAPADAFFERPAHPYTRRLLASVPTGTGELRDIPGEVPSLVAPPSGCRFHPRCDDATPECRAGRPAPRALARDHDVRCHHPVDGSGA